MHALKKLTNIVLNTDNFTTFLQMFPFPILSKVPEKGESFEGIFSGRNIFFKTYAGVTQSANPWYFLISLPSLIG